MPKRNRNRGRKGPSHNPSQPRSAEKVPKKQPPKEEVAGLTRRKVLGIGTIALVSAALGHHFLRDEEVTQAAPPKTVTQKPSVKPTILEYEDWSKIELPAFDPGQDRPPLTEKEILDHFLPPNVDRARLPEFYEAYDGLTQNLLRVLSGTDNFIVHMNTANDFVDELNKAFKHLTHDASESTAADNMALIKHTLIPHRKLTLITIRNQRLEAITFFDINQTRFLSLGPEAEPLRIPVVGLENESTIFLSLSRRRQRKSSFGSMYSKTGRYILTSEAQQINNLNGQIKGWHDSGLSDRKSASSEDIKDEYQRSLAHEAMHAYMNPPWDASGLVKPKGVISMGPYELTESDYSWANLHQVHELGACGFGLAHGGSTTLNEAIRIARNRTGTYQLAGEILLREMANSPSVNEAMRRKVLIRKPDGRITYRNYQGLFELAHSIPDEEFHRIGERMAKLGIYLTQEN